MLLYRWKGWNIPTDIIAMLAVVTRWTIILLVIFNVIQSNIRCHYFYPVIRRDLLFAMLLFCYLHKRDCACSLGGYLSINPAHYSGSMEGFF